MIPTNRVPTIPGLDMDITRRGNYDSGEDFVLEYGELRFTFNERDFAERCEQAAIKLGFVSGRLEDPELEDLVNLAVNGEIQDPASALGEHVNDCWPELVGTGVADGQPRGQRAAGHEVDGRKAAGAGQRRIQRDDGRLAADGLRRRGDHRERAALGDVARRRQRLARGRAVQVVERVD